MTPAQRELEQGEPVHDTASNFLGEQAAQLARGTIDFLAAQNIPLTAANYEVWLAHKLRTYPALSNEIEARLAKGEAFTEAVSQDLFARFFSTAHLSTEIADASESVARELADVMSILRGGGEQTGSFANALQSAEVSFAAGADPTRFSSVVSGLIAATREMADYNRQLSEQMATSSRQVAALQTTLHAVRLEALSDGLTGLANRRMFDQTLRRCIAETDSGGSALCLLMCDIDHFKRFNDTWGHLLGDHVIRFIANALRKHIGDGFLAARYGGEEFAVIMPGATLEEARAVAVAIHAEVRSKHLTKKSSGETIGAITLSLGVARHKPGERASDFIGRADALLYASKHAGRDRITTDRDADARTAA